MYGDHGLTSRSGQLIIIDEVGMLELQDEGWSENVSGTFGTTNDLVLSVRDTFLERIRTKWDLRDAIVADITKNDPESAI
jgi:nucleoside-triphosphatase THEP1